MTLKRSASRRRQDSLEHQLSISRNNYPTLSAFPNSPISKKSRRKSGFILHDSHTSFYSKLIDSKTSPSYSSQGIFFINSISLTLFILFEILIIFL